jgi:hypothetical protein
MQNFKMTLNCDWEKTLREAHNCDLPKGDYENTRIWIRLMKRTLNARIKEIYAFIKSGAATVRDLSESEAADL